jgi:hypothetical protein
MKHLGLYAAAAVFAIGIGSAQADECSGHSHDTDTAVGAVGGAAIGGLASHSIGGAVIGGVVGGLAGNAIGRANDCDHPVRESRRDAYEAGRDDQANVDADRARDDQHQAYEAGRDDQAYRDEDRPYR